jgi:hypothetical protein
MAKKIKIKELEELIAHFGVDPTEFEFARFAAGVKQLEEWKSALACGTNPADFLFSSEDQPGVRRSGSDIREKVLELEADLLAEAKTWRDYRVPKKRNVEVEGNVSVGLADVLKAMNDGRGSDT